MVRAFMYKGTNNRMFSKIIIRASRMTGGMTLFLGMFLGQSNAFAAVGQILNGNFFQNPAELSVIDRAKVIAGSVFISPTLTFDGTYNGNTGTAVSKAADALPYLLADYRLTDKFVAGINLTPSTYGHIAWPEDSIVSEGGTTTKLIYYRLGAQFSYQLMNKLSLGAGVNLEYNRNAELDFAIPNRGTQYNKARDYNTVADIGLFYKINTKNFITAAAFSGVDTFSPGTSTLGTASTNNYAFLLLDAPVAYIGAQHLLNDKWFLEEKIYWSGWSLVKNVVFSNTVTGTYVFPVDWKDILSYQVSTRYAVVEKVAVLGSILYDENAVDLSANQIGYPVSSSLSVSGGLDFTLNKTLSAQLVYTYGTFAPKAIIANASGQGTVDANIQIGTIQFVYKV